jgi:hypothetical protein
VGGKGKEGCYLYGPEDLLNKNVSYTYYHQLLLNYHQKHTENEILNENLKQKIC